MSDNINKVVERGAKLEDLEERAGQNLTHKPHGFYISLPVACSVCVMCVSSVTCLHKRYYTVTCVFPSTVCVTLYLVFLCCSPVVSD